MNHVARAFEMYHRLLNSTEVDFAKFSQYDPIKMVNVFKRAEFEKAIKDEFIKPFSYLLSTWGQLDLSQEVRTEVNQFDGNGYFTGKKWETIPLAQSMFGHEILDIPEFRKGENIFQIENGQIKRDLEGRPIHAIDYHKVNANKEQLYIQVVKGLLAAQLADARDKHSRTPGYDLAYWHQIYDSLASIPTYLEGTEYSLKKTKAGGRFFSKEDLDWIRKTSGSEEWRLYFDQGKRDVGKGLILGGGEFMKKFLQGITAGAI